MKQLHWIKTSLVLICCLGWVDSIYSQVTQKVAFDDSRWVFDAAIAKVEPYKGRQSLHLKGGTAHLEGPAFTDGTIEFDISFAQTRGFLGMFFRRQSAGNHEEYYMRAHQSGNPDAMQYTPVFNGLSGWQLYYGAGYSVPFRYVFDEWMHVKVVFKGKQAAVYLAGSDEPTLYIPELKREVAPGQIGLIAVTGFSEAYYSNFRYSSVSPELPDRSVPSPELPAGLVLEWSILPEAFADSLLADKTGLPPLIHAGKPWTTATVESSGVLNLARWSGAQPGRNTMLVRLTIESEIPQRKAFQYGFSDQARIYLNGDLLAEGSDAFTSRDYRFLGTIGWYDTVYLPLQKGRNELVIAVTETFGGWGIQAAIPDRAGIRTKP